MTDAENLFLVVVGFYVAECAFWVRTGMFVFACQLGGWRLWRINLRWALLRNPHGGVLLGNLLPWGQASIVQQWPLSLSPFGVYGFVSQALSRDGRPDQPERFIRYEQIRKVEARGAELFINGKSFARLAVPSFAQSLADTVRQLTSLAVPERGPLIESALARHLDATAVRERLQLFRDLSADLKITCSLLFFMIFLLPPILVFLESLFPLGVFLGSYFGLAVLAVLQFHRAHLVLYPREKLERWKQTIIMLVSPADVIHARDKLARHLLGEFSPLAVAYVTNAPDEFREFAGEIWRDLEYPMLPICPTPDLGPVETEAWFRLGWQALVRRFLCEAGCDVEAMHQPPAPDDPTSLSYCPRCRGQNIMPAGSCFDCGGRPLRGFS